MQIMAFFYNCRLLQYTILLSTKTERGWVGVGAGDEAQEGGVTDQPVEEEGAGGGDVPCWYR